MYVGPDQKLLVAPDKEQYGHFELEEGKASEFLGCLCDHTVLGTGDCCIRSK